MIQPTRFVRALVIPQLFSRRRSVAWRHLQPPSMVTGSNALGEVAVDLEQEIRRVLRTPKMSVVGGSSYGFDALQENGSTRLGISEQVLADMARAALTKSIPGVVFNDITAHRDGNGQLIKIEVDFMDEVHDPSSRTAVVEF